MVFSLILRQSFLQLNVENLFTLVTSLEISLSVTFEPNGSSAERNLHMRSC